MQVLSVVGFYPRVPALWTRALPSITSFDTNVLTVIRHAEDGQKVTEN